MPGNLKDTKIKDGEIKSLIKTKRGQIALATRTRTHVPTHTQLISRNGKEIEITHNTRQMGVGIKEK